MGTFWLLMLSEKVSNPANGCSGVISGLALQWKAKCNIQQTFVISLLVSGSQNRNRFQQILALSFYFFLFFFPKDFASVLVSSRSGWMCRTMANKLHPNLGRPQLKLTELSRFSKHFHSRIKVKGPHPYLPRGKSWFFSQIFHVGFTFFILFMLNLSFHQVFTHQIPSWVLKKTPLT